MNDDIDLLEMVHHYHFNLTSPMWEKLYRVTLGGLLSAQHFTAGTPPTMFTPRKHHQCFPLMSMEDILLWDKPKFKVEMVPRLDVRENVTRCIILMECWIEHTAAFFPLFVNQKKRLHIILFPTLKRIQPGEIKESTNSENSLVLLWNIFTKLPYFIWWTT